MTKMAQFIIKLGFSPKPYMEPLALLSNDE